MDPVIDESNEAPIFRALNLSVIPVWAAMIIAPRSKLTARLVRWSDAMMAALAAAYALQFAHMALTSDQKFDVSDLVGLREGMGKPAGFLIGWTHFIAFDLFVGRWIWRTALEEQRNARLALALTLMAGPAGLGVFGLQRRSMRSD